MNQNELGSRRRLHRLTGLLLMTGAAGIAHAHDNAHDKASDKGHETIGLVMQQPIPEANGKVVTIATVRYAPGQSSEAHQHPGSIFAFVTEGAVVSQLAGEPAKTYTKGQGGTRRPVPSIWYPRMRVRPNQPHWWCGPWARRISRSSCRWKNDPATGVSSNLKKEFQPVRRHSASDFTRATTS